MSYLATATAGGGAALDQVILASALGGGMTALLVAVVWAHRTRRTTLLVRVGDALGKPTGVLGWVALPTLLCTGSLLTALFGMYWDISLHIGHGRDPGPLANPAHYPILFGLFGVFAAGVLAVAMPLDFKPGAASVKIRDGWYAPVGGLLLAGAGGYALLGFPLDDIWHRLFGQDVTLWGPTHLMLIGGAGLSLIGLLVIEQEGRAGAHRVLEGRQRIAAMVRRSSAAGGMLIGLSVFQGEFDFGVPQFRLVEQPALIAAAAGVTLVAARLWSGKGAALAAVGFFLVIRGAVSLAVWGLGNPTPRMALYVGSAVIVELVALAWSKRPLLAGAIAGFLIGTIGTGIEQLWSHAVMVLPWNQDMVVEGYLGATVVGTAAGIIGALLALGLRGELPQPRVVRTAFVGCLLAMAAVVGNGLIATVPNNGRVDLALGPVQDGRALVTARLSSTVRDPSWMQITAWQGDVPHGLEVVPMVQRGGDWVSFSPVPVTGHWKTMLRLHDGRTLAAAPVYMAADPAIGAKELPAADGPRKFIAESRLLQRERKLDVPTWLWGAACTVVLICTLILIAALAWGVGRVSRARAAVASLREADAALA
ncbi:MAG: conserved rane protein of unknown function [Frankiales bacterium]|nr:conserved rane protein of unknown function [Frankiales bacterium]